MPKLEDDYSLVLTQDVIWGDLDAFGHVNNTVYFRYFEDVRMAFFVKTGMSAMKEAVNRGPILASTQCDFKLPLAYPDTIQIGCRAKITGPKKIYLEYAIYSEQFSAIAAVGGSLVVYYDYVLGASCEIPGLLVSTINDF